MGTIHTFCVFVGFLALVSAKQIGGELENRLASIEATLDLVLQKNAQLESRVANLESENIALKATVEGLQGRVKVIDVDIGDETEEGDKTDNFSSKISGNKTVIMKPIQPKPKRQLAIVPSTVAFTAVVSPPSGLTNLGAGQTIIYDKIITNVGGAYHSTTGVFTAPHNGVYVFNFALMINPGDDEYLELAKNGKLITPLYGHGTGSSHLDSTSRTVTLEVAAGDEIWVRTSPASSHGTGTVHGYGYTTFSGWLIDYTE